MLTVANAKLSTMRIMQIVPKVGSLLLSARYGLSHSNDGLSPGNVAGKRHSCTNGAGDIETMIHIN